MKALSIRQPWAFAILYGGKDIENRSWPTRQRGTIGIHASASMTRDEAISFRDFIQASGLAGLWCSGIMAMDLPRGGIVGLIDIVDCTAGSSSPWFFGPFGFVLANPRPISIIPCKGKLGFFDLDQSIADQLAQSTTLGQTTL